MRENLTTGEIPFRKAYLKSLLENGSRSTIGKFASSVAKTFWNSAL
jgi:hypothetical protein